MVAAILEVASTSATKAVHDDPPNQDVSPYACRVDTASAVASLMFVENLRTVVLYATVLCQETGIRAISLILPPETHTFEVCPSLKL